MVFARKENLQKHRLNCANEDNSQVCITRVKVNCKFCKVEFYSLASLQKHMDEHYCSGGTWRCTCQLTSVSPELFLTHVCQFARSHKSCTVCGKKFNSQNEFVEHKNHPVLKIKKPDSSRLCEICGTLSGSTTSARTHRKFAHSDKSYICSHCGVKFTRLPLLLEHSKKHSNMIWECTICSKKFATEKLCNFHMKTMHTDPKFTCNVCNKKFRQRCNLKKHLLSHEVACDFSSCNLKFSNMKQLKIHYLSMHQNSTEKCDQCEEVFASITKLKEHVRKRHNNMYKCVYCAVQCRYRTSLRRHLAAKHKDQAGEWNNPQAILNMQIPGKQNSPPKEVTTFPSPDLSSSVNNVFKAVAENVTEEEPLSFNANLPQSVVVDGESLTVPITLVSDTPSSAGLTSIDAVDQSSVVVSLPVVLPEGCVLLENCLVAKPPSEDSAFITVNDLQASGTTNGAYILADESVAGSNLQLHNNIFYYLVDSSLVESTE